MKLLTLPSLCFLYFGLNECMCKRRNYVPEEENRNRMSYFLVDAGNGTYKVEDLRNYQYVQVATSMTDVTYYFCTQSDRNGTVVDATSKLLPNSFNPKNEILVLIHGWRNDYNSSFNNLIKSAILDKYNINVIVVDWSKVAYKTYIAARSCISHIGQFVGEFIKSLTSTYNLSLSRVSMVGHSLGAHVAGVAGSFLHGDINYIIGLDPAGSLILPSDSDCLNYTNARFVEVIHTNGDTLGLMTSLGDSDYFPNSGENQPGCGLDITRSCSHDRSYMYYAESIRDNKFISVECDSYEDFTEDACDGIYSLMGGYRIDKNVTGDFYLNTNDDYPYAIGSV